MQNLAIGSHIKTSRTGYSHHGIYCGSGQVVHYSGFAQALKKGALEITTLQRFLGSETQYDIVNYPYDKVMFSSEEIVKRALSRVGEDSYNLVFNNCEHFAAWCVTGKSESKQVKAVLSLTTTTAVVYRSISTASSATQIIGLTAGSANIFTGTTATSSLAVGKLTGCATGALGGAALGTSSVLVGSAAIGSSGMLVGSSTALGLSAALGGGALTVAAAPVIVPVALAAGTCAIVGGLLGGFFD
ncbi:lecithin retinol acyltransferase family protein [Psychrobacter sp. P11G5]|uniref:lecithin retinol acyltransferase family protein n=1 Tax=Psychrobacter sp. P11G5 TaxID=1699624 RepID=UPI00078CF971|nr:lecithin retinol acyltransferase family protein [Psychrobacter sp. P11G5]AMN67219.1 hypothetical protein AK825_05400 [Psychrobacter sp. P11G5]